MLVSDFDGPSLGTLRLWLPECFDRDECLPDECLLEECKSFLRLDF